MRTSSSTSRLPTTARSTSSSTARADRSVDASAGSVTMPPSRRAARPSPSSVAGSSACASTGAPADASASRSWMCALRPHPLLRSTARARTRRRATPLRTGSSPSGVGLRRSRQRVGSERQAVPRQVHQQHAPRDREHPELEADRRGALLGDRGHERDRGREAQHRHLHQPAVHANATMSDARLRARRPRGRDARTHRVLAEASLGEQRGELAAAAPARHASEQHACEVLLGRLAKDGVASRRAASPSSSAAYAATITRGRPRGGSSTSIDSVNAATASTHVGIFVDVAFLTGHAAAGWRPPRRAPPARSHRG